MRINVTKIASLTMIATTMTIFSWQCSQRKVQSQEPNESFVACNTSAFAKSHIMFNLECLDNNLGDLNAPESYVFPAQTVAGKIPANVTFYINETGAIAHYNLGPDKPTENSPFVNTNGQSIAIAEPGFLRYFSKDGNGNFEALKTEKYEVVAGAPSVELSNLSRVYVSFTVNTSSFDMVSDSDGQYYVERGGNGVKGSGTEILTGSVTANASQNLVIDYDDLNIGENKLYVYVVNTAEEPLTSYSSLYLVRDDQFPYVQATPDQGSFRFDQSMTLASVEPGNIYYTMTSGPTTPADPADPTAASTLYTGAFNFTTADTTETVYKVKYISYDLAGNPSNVIMKTYKIDKKAPVLCGGSPCNADVSSSGGYFNASIYFLTSIPAKNQKFDVLLYGDEDCSYSLEINGGSQGNGEKILTTGNYTVLGGNVNVIGDGKDFLTHPSLNIPYSQTVNLYCTDPAGNTGKYVYPATVDNNAKTPGLIAPLVGWSIKSGNVDFSWKNLTTVESVDEMGAGVQTYEIQVAANIGFSPLAYTTGTAGTTASTALAAGKYYYRVRMIDRVSNASPWSGIRSFYFGKASTDLTNDVYEEMLVGAPLYNSSTGRAYLYRGAANCPNDCGAGAAVNPTPIATFTGENVGDQFGTKVALLEDVNGDGRADILISAPNATASGRVGAGKVYFFSGNTFPTRCPGFPGVACNITAASADAIVEGNIGGAQLGKSLASAGDFNNDGYGDFILGAPGATGDFINSGAAYVFYGSSSISSMPVAALTLPGKKQGGNFSSSLCHAGDMNGDGFADIFIGMSNGNSLAASSTGIGYLFYGSAAPDSTADVVMYGSENSTSQFGATCSRGFDVDNDGYEDLFVGAITDPSFGANYGKAFMFFGGSIVFTVPGWQFQAGQAGGLLGTSLLGLRLNSDSKSDFMLGAPGAGIGGNIYDFNGTGMTNPFTSGPAQTAQQASFFDGGPGVGNGIGANSMGIWGDLNNDGIDTFVVGNSGFNSNDGRILVYSGTVGTRFQISAPNSGEGFGASVSSRP